MVLKIRHPAPEFTAQAVVDGEFKTVSLKDYRGKYVAVVDGEFKTVSLKDYRGKYVVLFFYPLDFTIMCPTEIIAFSEKAKAFRQIGCEVLGCSTNSRYSHLAWINTPREKGGLGQVHIPLLADYNKEIVRAYNVVMEEGEDAGAALRGAFIIDREGILRQMTVNDLPVGRNVDEILRLVEAFQFVDEHGEVCPANWKKGDAGIKMP
ncbi:hypothetical protein P43SY_004575 [Pythium insidiosum]|uniref:thioredoxin-dependent peroxiredoxin n=1 Tax=Pythium insidiosum TaxID=114742 RepID=A0AAD5LR93_PYTIN|nr:hypothetical protein P43SY_004575 [Pythium insidiosum]